MNRLVGFGAVAAALVVVVPASAWAQCAAPVGWNPQLRLMCPDAPAMATDVNANFSQLHAWLEQRTGRVDGGVTFNAPVITGVLQAGGGLTTQGPVSFGGPVTFDGGITTSAPLVVNDVVRARGLQTTVLTDVPTGNYTTTTPVTFVATDLSVSFTLDVATAVDMSYALRGSANYPVPGSALSRLVIDGAEAIESRDSSAGNLVALTGRSLKVLAAGPHTVTVELFHSPGTLTFAPSNASNQRSLLVHVMGIAR